jgi:hypothetical protein
MILAGSVLAACGNGSEPSDPAPTVAATTAAPTTNAPAEPTEAVAEKPFFSADSPWNTVIDTATVDPRSADLLRQAKESAGVVEQANGGAPVTEYVTGDEGIYINTTRWTTPVVQGGVSTVMTCRQADCGQLPPGGRLNVPADVDPDPRYDGWFSIIDPDSRYVYDLWRGRREADGSISYQYLRRWSLAGPGYGKPYEVAARGSGLPLVGGLIRPGELQAGEINHALAISIPGGATGTFVQPATSTDGNGRTTSLPQGARIRLKSDVVLRRGVDPDTGKRIKLTAQQQRVGDAIVAALRTYGAIVVDRAQVPTLYAQRDVTTSLLSGNELQGMTLDDFEVVTLGSAYEYPSRDTKVGG